jgi:FkbM family methyltransferase
MLYGDYADPHFLNWVRDNLPKDGIIVDSGANVGQFLPYFSQVVPQGQILAFEPSPEASQWITDCLNHNPQMPVEVIPKGLGETEETMHLHVPGSESSRGLWGEIRADEGAPVSIRPLAEELNQRSIDTVHLWKLDVEGHGVPALRGAEPLLETQSVRSLYIEMTTKDENNKRILHVMKSYRYDCYLFRKDGSLGQFNQPVEEAVDGIFLPYESPLTP